MCGIVGAASPRNVVPILIEGIRRLEYRGYDSTGLAVLNGAPGAALTRLVSEGYESTYAHSSPKVRRRYRRLLCALCKRGRSDGVER